MAKASLREDTKSAGPEPVSVARGLRFAGENGAGLEWPRFPVGSANRSTSTSIPISPDCYRLSYRIWRIFEVVVAASVLLLTSPLMAALAFVIRRGTPGPAIFMQERIGVGGVPFVFLKFRTHYVDSEQRFPEWCKYEYEEEELQTVRLQEEHDPRVTPQGTWLRRTSLDELPNFWHVLTGEMALVGPRPEMAKMLPYYKGGVLRKFSVPPGITGLAQVSGRGELTFQQTVEYDLEYISSRSVKTDMRILLWTLRMVFNGAGRSERGGHRLASKPIVRGRG